MNFTFPDVKFLPSVSVAAVTFRHFLPTQLVIFNDVIFKRALGKVSVSFSLPCQQHPIVAHSSVTDRPTGAV